LDAIGLLGTEKLGMSEAVGCWEFFLFQKKTCPASVYVLKSLNTFFFLEIPPLLKGPETIDLSFFLPTFTVDALHLAVWEAVFHPNRAEVRFWDFSVGMSAMSSH